jgi:hypothetical protein
MTIYPNPAKNELTLSLKHNDVYDVSVSNLFGQVLMHTQNKNEIDMSDLKAGVYIIAITQGQNKFSQKLIKE